MIARGAAVLALLGAAFSCAARPVRAEPLAEVAPSPRSAPSTEGLRSPHVEGRPHALRNDSTLFLVVEATSTAAVALTLSFSAGSSATACGWCGTNSLDVSVRNALYVNDSRAPALASHVVSLGVLPVLSFGAVILPAIQERRARYAVMDGLEILNTFVLTTGVNDFVKKLAARERPGFHFGRQADTESSDKPWDRFRSFYSGDTAWAFTLAASSTTLAYERGYWTAPYVAIGGAALATATGTLRMVADMHWFTDVLTGAAMGTAVGAAMPLLLHPRAGEAPHARLVPFMPNADLGAMVTGEF